MDRDERIKAEQKAKVAAVLAKTKEDERKAQVRPCTWSLVLLLRQLRSGRGF